MILLSVIVSIFFTACGNKEPGDKEYYEAKPLQEKKGFENQKKAYKLLVQSAKQGNTKAKKALEAYKGHEWRYKDYLKKEDALAYYRDGYSLICNDILVNRASHPQLMNLGMLMASTRYMDTPASIDKMCILYRDASQLKNGTFYNAYDNGYDWSAGGTITQKNDYMKFSVLCNGYGSAEYIAACKSPFLYQSQTKLSKEEFIKTFDLQQVIQWIEREKL
jgi:hypothetical protein